MIQPTLRPCPFCGSTDIHPMADEMLPDETWWGHLRCAACDAVGPGDGWANSEAEAHALAIDAWNRRTLPEGMALVPLEITAETGHKAGMMGEFLIEVGETCPDCEGAGIVELEDCELCQCSGELTRDVSVSWTTIKAIHRRIVEISEVRQAEGSKS